MIKSFNEIMQDAALTHESRAAVYGTKGYKKQGKVLNALFPNGIVLKTEDDHTRWHLFNMCLAKLCRYAENFERGGHQDSVHDQGVYSFLLEEMDYDAAANKESEKS